MHRVTSARNSLKEETLLVPRITSSQPSSVSTTAMTDSPLTAQTFIHQTATHPKPLSIFLLSLIMAQVQPRNSRILLLPHSQPSPGNPQQWHTHVPPSPPLSEHHWEAFCILLSRRETCYLKQQSPKKCALCFCLFFSFSFFSCPHSFEIPGLPPTSDLPLSRFKETQSRIHTHSRNQKTALKGVGKEESKAAWGQTGRVGQAAQSREC